MIDWRLIKEFLSDLPSVILLTLIMLILSLFIVFVIMLLIWVMS